MVPALSGELRGFKAVRLCGKSQARLVRWLFAWFGVMCESVLCNFGSYTGIFIRN